MKEFLFLDTIVNTLSNSTCLGDDCAFLKDVNLVITQDTLVEDIHFSFKYTDAYKLGYKAVIVNISDLLASGADPAYISISLSLPKSTDTSFIKDFYTAVEDLSKIFNFTVAGGDLTGSDKVVISICAIGKTENRRISSRANVKEGNYIVVTGEHGTSACGLYLLQNGINNDKIIKEHLMPEISQEFSKEISTKAKHPYAMMDTSDGLADALYKMATMSNVTINIDFDKIPINQDIKKYNKNFENWVLFGGEDYKLVAATDEETLKSIPKNTYTIIGTAVHKQECPLNINFGNKTLKINNLDNTFNHF